MKTPRVSLLPCLLLACGTALAGPLDPPAGPPAPTHKTLSEIEPRKPLNALPGAANAVHVITQPGSYYLTGPIAGASGKDGILIAADNVSIDLNGFAVAGVAGAVSGITTDATRQGIRISNGSLKDWPVSAVALQATGSELTRLTVTGGGIGLSVGAQASVSQCSVSAVAQGGIVAGMGSTITHCTVLSCGGTGILAATGSTIAHSTAATCHTGFNAGHGSTYTACTAHSNVNGFGGTAAAFRDCVSYSNTGKGFHLGAYCTLQGCVARLNTGEGLDGGKNLAVTDCTFTNNQAGGAIVGAGSSIKDSTFSANGTFGATLNEGSTITGCTVYQNVGDGIFASKWCTITNNTCSANTGTDKAGIRVLLSGNRIEGNHLNGNTTGVTALAGGNLIVRNTFTFNPTRVNAAAGNNVAEMIIVPGDNFASTNTFANIAH